jgi:hypothetical protein
MIEDYVRGIKSGNAATLKSVRNRWRLFWLAMDCVLKNDEYAAS